MNNVTLIGRLTKDPEIKDVNGKALASFSVAVNAGKDKAYFFDCDAWEKTAEMMKHFTKGKQIGITGSLVQDTWEKDGKKFSKVKISVSRVDFCGDKGAAEKVEETFVNPFSDGDVPF